MRGTITFAEPPIAPVVASPEFVRNRRQWIEGVGETALGRWRSAIGLSVATHLVNAGFKVKAVGGRQFMNDPRECQHRDFVRDGMEIDGDLDEAIAVLIAAGFQIVNGEVQPC